MQHANNIHKFSVLLHAKVYNGIYNLGITLWLQLIVDHWTCIHVLLTWTMDIAQMAFYTSVLTLSKEVNNKNCRGLQISGYTCTLTTVWIRLEFGSQAKLSSLLNKEITFLHALPVITYATGVWNPALFPPPSL